MIAVVVLTPVERGPVWPLAHVCEEVFKAGPALADRNAAPAVDTPAIALRIGATGVHRQPGAVGSGSALTVRSVEIPDEVALLAPAAARSAAAEMGGAIRALIPAIAKATPVRSTVVRMIESQNEEPLKTKAREIRSGCHAVQRSTMWAVM
jgi:hypothetical protein